MRRKDIIAITIIFVLFCVLFYSLVHSISDQVKIDASVKITEAINNEGDQH